MAGKTAGGGGGRATLSALEGDVQIKWNMWRWLAAICAPCYRMPAGGVDADLCGSGAAGACGSPAVPPTDEGYRVLSASMFLFSFSRALCT